MEIISTNKLIGLSVYTQSGDSLGKISGLEIDKGSQQIINYQVKPSNILKELLAQEQELLINAKKVVSISSEKMIVEDLVLKQGEKGKLNKGTSPIPL